jgi:hypothetical protein
VHAISLGPPATRAASGIPEFDALLDKAKAPARSLVSIDDVGAATVFLRTTQRVSSPAKRYTSMAATTSSIGVCRGKKPVACNPAAVS